MPVGQSSGPAPDPGSVLADALRYWERRRIVYNLVLAVVVVIWVIGTWPHFRSTLTLHFLPLMIVLATMANVCYCAAYCADLPMQYTSGQDMWRRWRWVLWLAGMTAAIVMANYWIADEIYPYVS